MRGAATNGEFWIFFAYKRGAEASYYACTDLLSVRTGKDLPYVDTLLGILVDWVRSAFPALS